MNLYYFKKIYNFYEDEIQTENGLYYRGSFSKFTCFNFNHKKEFNLTSSTRTEGIVTVFWNTQLFLSFHITQTEAHKITFINAWVNLGSPAIEVNWIKCCLMLPGDTEEICNQRHTWCQRELNMSQCKNKCIEDRKSVV